MQVIKRITDSDMLGGEPQFMDRVSRYASRGILIDNQMHVAMMYMSESDLYKLPGGGIENSEQPEAAFLREIKEETGYGAEITHALGIIEEHKNRNGFMQLSYCYIAKAHHLSSAPTLTENELRLGMSAAWMTLDQALEAMNDSLLKCHRYSAKFMVLRDRTILEHAINLLTGQGFANETYLNQ
ncbi:NUDIX hydrolase [Paenibacillus aceris]|uniref:8-oxo-dGTP diphosphatase n=1 Tax=Paenibacillus aceris TaxID=869555 RepID=A0ABS4I087_9BACL|nr:NUDIX domain-containing protein [Paenibacillus aceris]MBP1963971.1 8-oxo-dGTP diphosphatase [Paenibacillus aceris]NHW34610.1 NUDIX domain-containing protein [Paenibacillus aceris]